MKRLVILLFAVIMLSGCSNDMLSERKLNRIEEFEMEYCPDKLVPQVQSDSIGTFVFCTPLTYREYLHNECNGEPCKHYIDETKGELICCIDGVYFYCTYERWCSSVIGYYYRWTGYFKGRRSDIFEK